MKMNSNVFMKSNINTQRTVGRAQELVNLCLFERIFGVKSSEPADVSQNSVLLSDNGLVVDRKDRKLHNGGWDDVRKFTS